MKLGRRRPSTTLRQSRRLVRSLPALVVLARLEPPPARHRRASLPGAPVVSRLIPRINDIVFRMLRHQFCLTANSRNHLGIAQIGHPMLHRPQPLRAQPLAARRHSLLRRLGLSPFWGRSHQRNVTCYVTNSRWLGDGRPYNVPLSRSTKQLLASAIHLQRRNKRLLRDVDLAELPHLLLAFLLLLQKFSLARDVAAVAFRGDVLAQRTDSFTGDDLAADRGLDRNLEHVRRDQFLHLLDHG